MVGRIRCGVVTLHMALQTRTPQHVVSMRLWVLGKPNEDTATSAGDACNRDGAGRDDVDGSFVIPTIFQSSKTELFHRRQAKRTLMPGN
jgi:hypothetical protein